MQEAFLDNDGNVKNFLETVSKPRLSKYLSAANGSNKDAIRLYHWNSQLSQSLYLVLQTWEVSLRNKINNFLIYKYNLNWPTADKCFRNLTGQDKGRLDEVLRRQSAGNNSSRPSTNHIVADLSAGFWVSQLGKSYAVPYGWHNNLKWRVFVHEPTLGREEAAQICNDLLDLRNRVAHHEPIFHLKLNDLKFQLDRLINAMCAGTAAYLASTCSFDHIWGSRPLISKTVSSQLGALAT